MHNITTYFKMHSGVKRQFEQCKNHNYFCTSLILITKLQRESWEDRASFLWSYCQRGTTWSNHEQTKEMNPDGVSFHKIIDLYSSKCQCPNRERFEELFQIWRNIAIKYNTWNWIESWTKRKKK